MGTPPPSWEDVAWLRSLWDGPFMLKGVIRVDDARRAVEDVGATAISVSNHGGNNLDGTPATIRALAAVVEAVDGRAEVLLDGGVRRGGDVVKALALGARAVMVGRPYLWGLAADGQAGVENVLDVLRSGIDSALLGPRARLGARPRPIRSTYPGWLLPAPRRLTSLTTPEVSGRPARSSRSARPSSTAAPAARHGHDRRVAAAGRVAGRGRRAARCRTGPAASTRVPGDAVDRPRGAERVLVELVRSLGAAARRCS